MKISFVYVKPGGNPTALVLTLVKRLKQVKIAEAIMKSIPACEQVGFIERAKNPKAELRLQMAGGEFCANALRSLAAWLASVKKGRPRNKFLESQVESSGTKELITISAKADAKGQVRSSTTQIPFSDSITFVMRKVLINKKMVFARLVNLDGISFLSVPQKFFSDKINLKRVFAKLYQNKKFNPKACGLIFYQKNRNRRISIRPIVYVRKTGTIIQESSCASGSVALMLGKKLKKIQIFQPSGYSLNVILSKKGLFVGGEVISIKLIAMEV